MSTFRARPVTRHWQILLHRHGRARYCRRHATASSSAPMHRSSLLLYPSLAFPHLRHRWPSLAATWANVEVLELYDFAHEDGVVGVGLRAGVPQFMPLRVGHKHVIYLARSATRCTPGLACRWSAQWTVGGVIHTGTVRSFLSIGGSRLDSTAFQCGLFPCRCTET